MIRPLVTVQSGYTAKYNAEDQSYDNCHQSQLCGHCETCADGQRDVTAVLERNAEITVQNVLHIINKLYANRLVEPVSLVQYLHNRFRFRLFAVERSAGDRVHGEERNEADQEHGNHCQYDSLYDVLSQLSVLSLILVNSVHQCFSRANQKEIKKAMAPRAPLHQEFL